MAQLIITYPDGEGVRISDDFGWTATVPDPDNPGQTIPIHPVRNSKSAYSGRCVRRNADEPYARRGTRNSGNRSFFANRRAFCL